MASVGKRFPYHKRYKPVDDFMESTHPSYRTWCAIKNRCYNPDATGYDNYGGRGIRMCDRWMQSFEAFASDMGVRPSIHHSIDRFPDNDGNYEPGNCRWATNEDQNRNRRKFKTNSTGYVGVVKVKNGAFSARFDYDGVRYELGRFATADAACDYRQKFIETFAIDRELAMTMTERRQCIGGTTGILGISKHTEGFIVRKTINKVRIYLGFRKTLDEAIELWNATR
jgi:hypothetical protein